MQERWTRELLLEEDAASEAGGDGPFCPECGQSLDLTRHRKIPAKRRTREPFVFLILGLCLTVAFGLRAWNTQAQLSRLDQQIAALRAQATQGPVSRPGNPAMIVADTLDEVLTDQQALQVGFNRDVTGIELGLFTIIVGAASWLLERREVANGRRKRVSPQDLPSSGRPQAGSSPWEPGCLVATTLVRTILLMFVAIVGIQLIHGVSPSLQLIDQALTRIAALVETIASSLS